MSDEIRQIAARIRELREVSELSQETLARELGLEADKYRDYESGTVDIPIGLMYEIARRFGVELTSLLTGHEPRLHVYCLTRKGEGMQVERQEAYGYQNLAHNFVHKKAEPFLVTVDASGADATVPFNTHPGQEFNYVLEGRMQLSVGGHDLVLEQGDSVYFDASYPHGMKALSDQPARFLAIIL